MCEVNTHDGENIHKSTRPLLEKGSDIFIRYNQALPILKKVLAYKEDSFDKLVSGNDPFGFDVREENSYKRIQPDFKLKSFSESVNFYYNKWYKKGLGHIKRNQIRKNTEWVNEHKVYITKAYGAGETYPHQIINKPFLGKKLSCCTETYLVIGPFESKEKSHNVVSYISTRFFRFLVLLRKISQGAYKDVYSFVPMQDFSRPWTDEDLYKKYKLTNEEIDFIESMIRPME
jgi:site-specific DNA-methyltransferase (adenine-specific)